MKLGMYIMAAEPVSAPYFMNASHQSVCLMCIPPSLLGKNVTATTNEDASMEELLDASIYMRSTPFKRK
jgi:hypothetical protein